MLRPRNSSLIARKASGTSAGAETNGGRSDSSYSVFTEAEPPAKPAFFHKSAHDLYNVTAPVVSQSPGWTAFSEYDCEALEHAFISESDIPVLIGIERLHSVDVKQMRMQPVYWTSITSSSATTDVIRSLWFYTDKTPVKQDLSDALERGYKHIKPWTSAYEAEMRSAQEIGGEAESKIRHTLMQEKFAIYKDGESAWVGSDSFQSRLANTILGSIGKGKRSPYVEVRRGYQWQDLPKPSTPTDLILVIHGIGQKLAETSPGWTFTNAVNKLRQLMHEQRDTVKGVLREDYNPQILPVNWRTAFDPDKPNAKFSLKDITIDSIPAVRDLLAKVALDVPYFMSHHRSAMVDAVVGECNRLFRLFVDHNPDFSGKVHLIGHSLGSAIAFEILSRQPADVNRSSLYDVISRRFTEPVSQFDFNTHHLFNCGAPAPFFLLLMDRNLVPRKGLKSSDSRLTRPARYGSLAARNIYNIYYQTDPVAYRLLPAVDASFAQILPPTIIPAKLKPDKENQKEKDKESGLPPAPGRLPSTVELETHNFAKESLADGRLRLLNENGQIDYILPQSTSVMGLESQYLSMIYAHQAYWDSREFARLILVECGRKGEPVHWLRGQRRPPPPTQPSDPPPPRSPKRKL
ncbi:hypothetical protein PYCC9005_005478 [Savitreella phatthalungensis]